MNQLNNVKLFIEAWDSGKTQDPSIKKFVNKSILGNINIRGDYYSDKSILFTKNDNAFYDSIEEHIKKLVYTIVKKFNWITYSSCQGHPSYNGIAYKKRIIQLLPRNNKEKNVILDSLEIVKKKSKQLISENNPNNINVLILQEYLESIQEARNYESIKIQFDNNGMQEDQYFNLINHATEIFIICLEKYQYYKSNQDV